MTLRCDEILELLTPYQDGELDAARRGVVDAHLADCASCRRDRAELQALVGAVRAVPRVPAPSRLLADVNRLIDSASSARSAETAAPVPERGRGFASPAHGTGQEGPRTQRAATPGRILEFPTRKVRWAPHAGAVAAGVLAALVGALVMIREEADRASSRREEYALSKGAPVAAAARAPARPRLHAAKRDDAPARDESRAEADAGAFMKEAAPARLKSAAKDGFDAPSSPPVASAAPAPSTVPAGPREAEEKAVEPARAPALAAAPPASAKGGALGRRAAEPPAETGQSSAPVATRIRAEVFASDPAAACRWTARNAEPLEVALESVEPEAPAAVVQGKNIRPPDIVQGNRLLYLREADRIRLRGTPAQIRTLGDRLESRNYLVRTPTTQDAYAAWRGGDREEERRIQLETGALLDRAGGLRTADALVAQSNSTNERRTRTAARSAATEGSRRVPTPESELAAAKSAAPAGTSADAAPASAAAESVDLTARQEAVPDLPAVQAATVDASAELRIEVELRFLPLSAWGETPAESRERR